ncbi:MAG: hypothetical protein M1482_08305 [Chloroflexi bacterium]|nr:hypothetical protein [Chloroflexota bacterium]
MRNTDPTGHGPRDQWYHAIWAAQNASAPATTGSSQGTSGGGDDDGGTGKLIDSGSHGYVRPYVSDLKGLARKLVGESTSGGKTKLAVPEKIGLTQSERIKTLQDIAGMQMSNGADDLQLLIALTEADAGLTADNTGEFVDDMTLITLGWHPTDAAYCGYHGSNVCASEGRIVKGAAFGWPWRGGTGFIMSYRDPPGLESNQVGHFWEYVAASYETGPIAASAGNDFHELFGQGNSWQDHALGERGVELGWLLSRPFIRLRPSDVPGWLGNNVGLPTQ